MLLSILPCPEKFPMRNNYLAQSVSSARVKNPGWESYKSSRTESCNVLLLFCFHLLTEILRKIFLISIGYLEVQAVQGKKRFASLQNNKLILSIHGLNTYYTFPSIHSYSSKLLSLLMISCLLSLVFLKLAPEHFC